MFTVAAAFFLALGLALLLVPLCRRLAFRAGCVAAPRADRWHRQPTPLFGGVAIGLSLFAVVIGFGRADEVAVLLGCAAIVFVVGLADDLRNFKPASKLIVEIALASALLFFGYRLNWVSSITADTVLTLLWIVGITNAFNLLDNMDGLCAGIALIVGTALLVEMVPGGPGGALAGESLYLAALLGATAGFLVYNFHPASIFMGDSGSLLLGLSFAALTLTTAQDSAQSNVLTIVAAPVFVLLIPIFDTTLVTVMRTISGRRVSAGGRDHSSHRLVAIGLSERAAVMVLWLLAAMGGGVALVMRFAHQSWSVLAAGLFLVSIGLFAVYLARIRVYESDARASLPEGRVTPIVVDFMYKRRVAEVLLDFCLIVIAYYLAYRLRFEEPEDFLKEFRNFVTSLPVVLASQLIAFFIVGVYRGVWRYFGMMDAVTVVKGVVFGTFAAQLVLLYLFHFFSYSRTVFVMDAVLLTGLMTLSRASFRLIGEFVLRQRSATRRAVIYGAGDGAGPAVNQLRAQDQAVSILGLIDDDPKITRMRVAGYPVLGDYRALEVLVSTASVDLVVISGRLIDADRLAALEALCAQHGVALARLHVGLEELVATPRTPQPAAAESHLRRVGP